MDRANELLRAMRRYQEMTGQDVPLAKVEEMAAGLGIGPFDAPAIVEALAERGAVALRYRSVYVWEAVHILDGLLKNRSKIQPDTLHADTQGQNEPVFG